MNLTKEKIEEIRHYGVHVIAFEERAEGVIALCDLALKGLRAEVDATDAIDILRGLVALKDRKDSIGKDDTYEKMQPVLWQRARTFLEGL